MDKLSLHNKIIVTLETVLQVAVDAAKRAHETAMDDENKAENKYDTLGLEASYLAHGQSQRVAECEADLLAFRKLTITDFSEQLPVARGALVTLVDELGIEQMVFMGPAAGGLVFSFMDRDIMIITPSAPLGKLLSGCQVGDEVEIDVNQKKHYQVVDIR